jgi:hypothetical protein
VTLVVTRKDACTGCGVMSFCLGRRFHVERTRLSTMLFHVEQAPHPELFHVEHARRAKAMTAPVRTRKRFLDGRGGAAVPAGDARYAREADVAHPGR